MNNRILATLFALAIVLFIGVAPVKAEAAHTCYDNSGNCICDYAGCTETVHTLTKVEAVEANHEKAGNTEYYVCDNCGKLFTDETAKTETTAEDVIVAKIEHELKWEVTETTHKQYCTGCGYVPVKDTAHTLSKKDNGDGTHTIKCTVEGCTYEVTAEHDDGTKADCKCGVCGAEMEHTPSEWKEYPSDKSKHFQQCTVCFKTLVTEDHDYVCTSNEDGQTHKAECKVCGKVRSTASCYDKVEDCYCDACGGLMKHDIADMQLVHKTATCTEDGIWLHYQCEICGLRMKKDGTILTEETMVNPKTGHTEAVRHYADVHQTYCTVCGETISEEAHDFVYTSDGKGNHVITCTGCPRKLTEACQDTDGDGDCLCDACGYEMPHTDKSKMTYVEAKAATCEEAGHTDYYKCNECGGTYLSDGSAWDPTIDALGHIWTPVGKTVNGKHQMQCDRCDVYSEGIGHYSEDGDCYCDVEGCNVLVHSHRLIHVDKVEPTCGQDGTEAYYMYEGCGKMFDEYLQPITAPVVIEALDHDDSGEWVAIEGGMHAKQCANCGETLTTEAHTDGTGDNRCDVCNVELELEKVERKEPNCTDVGYEEYWVSPVTGIKYADPYGNERINNPATIPANGHSWTRSEGSYHICGVCNLAKKHTASDINDCFCGECHMPMSGHEVEVVEAVAATCTKSGTEAYVKCSCGKLCDFDGNVIEKPDSIPAYGHKLSNELIEDTRTGDHYQVCTNAGCDYEYHTDHEPVVEDPLKGNYHQWICECGNVETERHYDKDGDNKCDECGHDMANTSVNVQNHDSVTVVTGEKKTVNNQKSWWQNWLDNLLPSNAGGTSTTAASASNDSASTSGSGNTTSGGSTAADTGSGTTNSGSAASGSGSTTSNGSGSTSSGTGIINEFIQWLSQLFGSWLQGK